MRHTRVSARLGAVTNEGTGAGARAAMHAERLAAANSTLNSVVQWILVLLLAAVLCARAVQVFGEGSFSDPNMVPVNDLPNPYSAKEIMPLPDGRAWGSTAGVDAAKGHDDIWAIDRCGSNTCVGSSARPSAG